MRPPPDAAIAQWLQWLETLHPAEVELGLDRTRQVAQRLGVDRLSVPVITVAGTNGKGSVCTFLEGILQASGKRVGLYTSPHVEHYRERVRIAGREIDDEALRASLTAVDEHRGSIPLTFFEFGTLAALLCFSEAGVERVILETGLGGRLDATNVVDSDVAVITSIGIDHAEWLGADRDSIAREKAGIARAGRPLVVAENDLPPTWSTTVADTGACEIRRDRDYGVQRHSHDHQWDWWLADETLTRLPMPTLAGGYQTANAAAALAALTLLDGAPPARRAITAGLAAARLPGRLESIPGDVETILDVGHNPQAALALAGALAERPVTGRTLCVIGVYADKDAEGIIAALCGQIDIWLPVALPPPRGAGTARLVARLARLLPTGTPVRPGDSVEQGVDDAASITAPGDRIVVTGSFATVARARAHFL